MVEAIITAYILIVLGQCVLAAFGLSIVALFGGAGGSSYVYRGEPKTWRQENRLWKEEVKYRFKYGIKADIQDYINERVEAVEILKSNLCRDAARLNGAVSGLMTKFRAARDWCNGEDLN